jgi:hypothetical protein
MIFYFAIISPPLVQAFGNEQNEGRLLLKAIPIILSRVLRVDQERTRLESKPS